MHRCHDCLLVRHSCLLLLLIIRPEFLVMEDHTHCHEPDHMSKMLVASLRYLALPLVLAGLIHHWINARIGDQVLVRFVVIDLSQLG